jgi:tripeptidyl-peptidase I
VVAVNGQFRLLFGPSASSPVFASLITLVNDARLAAGKGPVGFINPVVSTDIIAQPDC